MWMGGFLKGRELYPLERKMIPSMASLEKRNNFVRETFDVANLM